MRTYVVGASMTRFGRRPDVSVKQLVEEAVRAAIADAGLSLDRIRAGFFACAMQGALEGQHAVAGQVALRSLGLERWPVFNVENACASGDTALLLADSHLRAGAADIALVVGVERMTFDKAASFGWLNGAWDIDAVEPTLAGLRQLSSDVPTPDDALEPMPDRKSLFMDIYASLAKHHMHKYGLTQRQLAAVAAKNHNHSVLNERAQYHRRYTIDEILEAPTIAWPITLPMCAPITDGAAAVVLCTDEALKRLDASRAVTLAAIELGSGTSRSAEELDRHVTVHTAERAYARAGVGPQDIDIAEVHDATSFGEVLHTENLSLVPRGEGGAAAARGETSLGGRIPVNVSGGLVSKGHPIAATGLAKTFELVTHLRGEAGARQVPSARWGIAHGAGGFLGVEDASACVTILGRR